MKSGGDTKRTPRLRLLSREELALWLHVTADVKPRVKNSSPGEDEGTPAKATPRPEPARVEQRALACAQNKAKLPAAPALTPLAPLDRRLKRKLSSGRARVDDAIDLHGMTQAQAHRALTDFLWRAANSGAKVVLVITGKGNLQNGGDYHAEERGVLRRHAPQWLRSPALRSIVLSVDEAARPHGGSGALYVRLRRRLPES